MNPLRPRSIKFDPEVWELTAIEAQHLGISTAEFVRSAVLARAMVCRLRRQGDAERWAGLYETVDEFLKQDPLSEDEASASSSS